MLVKENRDHDLGPQCHSWCPAGLAAPGDQEHLIPGHGSLRKKIPSERERLQLPTVHVASGLLWRGTQIHVSVILLTVDGLVALHCRTWLCVQDNGVSTQ